LLDVQAMSILNCINATLFIAYSHVQMISIMMSLAHVIRTCYFQW